MGEKEAVYVGVYDSLTPVYNTSSNVVQERYRQIQKQFELLYGVQPQFYCRAPGRVNIIGEHIDYCGYGVLPMAVEQDIVIAAAPNKDHRIYLSNTDSKFDKQEIDIGNYKIDGKEWYHYFLCGFKGVVDHLKIAQPTGMSLLVDGSVPKNAGLSSSSAFVCCSGLVTMHANGAKISKKELAEVCTKCERYIGTEGGGMDQACSFLAEHGTAKHIEFDPLRFTNISIPDGVVFVIANSLVEMNKSQSAGTHFNLRVVECRTAAQILAKMKGLDWKKKDIRKLGQTQEELGLSLEEMLDCVEKLLHKEPYSRNEIREILEITDDEFVERSLSESTKEAESFKLHNRAKHVYSEAKRVKDFCGVCQSNQEKAIEYLGDLMNASHESCSVQYECSCEELDNLVQQCRSAGALGSRLTGAGWGGCTVSMVPTDKVHDFLHKVRVGYYSNNPKMMEVVDENLFATSPAGGAAILKPTAVGK